MVVPGEVIHRPLPSMRSKSGRSLRVLVRWGNSIGPSPAFKDKQNSKYRKNPSDAANQQLGKEDTGFSPTDGHQKQSFASDTCGRNRKITACTSFGDRNRPLGRLENRLIEPMQQRPTEKATLAKRAVDTGIDKLSRIKKRSMIR